MNVTMNKYHTSPSTSQTNLYNDNSLFRSTSPLPPPATTVGCLSATTKSYKYLRKLVKFDQMDFEFALWQMFYLFISPQKLYRNFSYRKRTFAHLIAFFSKKNCFFSISRSFADFSSIFGIFNWILSFLNKNLIFSKIETKSQFARDDPAFLVLLILCVFGKLKGLFYKYHFFENW